MGCIVRWDALCDGDASCARSSRGFCRKLVPVVLPGMSWGPPPPPPARQRPVSVGPRAPSSPRPDSRGAATPGQAAGSQLCGPAAPSLPAMSAHPGWNLPPEGDPIVPQTPHSSLLPAGEEASTFPAGNRRTRRAYSRPRQKPARPQVLRAEVPGRGAGPVPGLLLKGRQAGRQAGRRGEQSEARRVTAEWLSCSQASGFCSFLGCLTVGSLY